MAELKEKVREHFDDVSPYYHDLWGMHIHHGFWKTGTESKEKAQEQLIDEVIRRGRLEKGCSVLDVGCGIGGTAVYLAKKLDADVTGITLAPKQVEMAREIASSRGVDARFLVMDGERITLDEQFDVVCTIEVISHYYDKKRFFEQASTLLKRGGKVAMAVWLKAEHLTRAMEEEYIHPIERGMLLPYLCTMHDYLSFLHEHGFRLLSAEDVTPRVAKTWDLCLDIIKKPALWNLAFERGAEFVDFLKAFRAMQRGCKSRAFVYGIITAEKA